MKIIISTFFALILVSCGGGSENQQPPKVTTLGETSDFTLAKFSDADWLYNNYFGEYNLPAGFKASIIDDLKRAANSMVMYDAQGGDSQQMMVKMDMMAREAFTKEMSMSSIGSAFTSYDAANIKADKQASLGKMAANGIKPLTDVEIAKIKKDKEAFNKLNNPEFYAYTQQQKALVDEYSLPYALANSPRKVYNIENAFLMKGGGGGGKGGGGKNEPEPPTPPASGIDNSGGAGPYRHNITRWQWKDADMITVSKAHTPSLSNTGIYGWYTHMGMYVNGTIVDAMPDRPTGVQKTNWRRFERDYQYVIAAGVRSHRYRTPWLTRGERLSVTSFVSRQIGRSYAFTTPTKTANLTSGPTYCSLLTWSGFKVELGLDVDVDGGRWVVPDDIVYDSQVWTFAASRYEGNYFCNNSTFNASCYVTYEYYWGR